MLNLSVVHQTIYRYRRPVRLGQHRLMVRPRDSHDLRLVSAMLTLSPPGATRWLHDVFGNSIALIDYAEPAEELRIESALALAKYSPKQPHFPVEPTATAYPFIYSTADRSDLGRLLEQHYPDNENRVADWAKQFVTDRPKSTLELLSNLNAAFRAQFRYEARDEKGTQSPVTTLERKSGSCRDFALLFIEAARVLGFGARFVSGYLYDPQLDEFSLENEVQGAGATHAWADVYIPGAGWVEYDPTNNMVATENLIRVATTRDPTQAIPVSGTYDGDREDFLDLEVKVTVTAKKVIA